MRLSIAILVASFLFSLHARALFMVGGKEKMVDHNWPAGSLDVVNHKSRISWWEGPGFGSGEFGFLYRGDTATLNDVLDRFARINTPELVVVIHDGILETGLVSEEKNGKADKRVDWSLTLWEPSSYYLMVNGSMARYVDDLKRFGGDVAPTLLDIYVSEGRVAFEGLAIPQGVKVIDERTAAHGYKPEDGAVVNGVAYDLMTSKPVPAVEITIQKSIDPPAGVTGAAAHRKWEVIASTVGDSEGRYELKNIPPGGCKAVLRCNGYATRELDYVDFRSHTFKSFITRLSPACGLSGRVVDPDNKPIGDVEVHATHQFSLNGREYRQPEDRIVITDTDVNFEFTDLPRGDAEITAWATGYHHHGSLKPVSIPGEPMTIHMTRTGAIHVRVIDSDGKPVHRGNVAVWAAIGRKVGTWGGEAELKSDGTYTFAEAPAGKYFASADPQMAFAKEPIGTPFEVKGGRRLKWS